MITEETDPATSVYCRHYARLMQTVWSHHQNDQRPAVLKWLRPLRGAFRRMLDIGGGDAYYLDAAAERLRRRRAQRFAAAGRARCLIGAGDRISRLQKRCQRIRSLSSQEIDFVLMSHVLLYMELEEIDCLLRRVRGKPLVIIYPDPNNAVSVAFEEYAGLNNSREKIALKASLLGRPQVRCATRSHLRCPVNVNSSDLAFLVSHHTLDRAHPEKLIRVAEGFVQKHIQSWRQTDQYLLPQDQILESYNLPVTLAQLQSHTEMSCAYRE